MQNMEMIRPVLEALLGQPGPAQLRGLLQIALGIILMGALWLWLRPKDEESAFQIREAEKARSKTGAQPDPGSDELARARMKPRPKPMALPGIRVDGAPHEVLGIRVNSNRSEIQKAYRELMKRYHPDKIGPAGSPQWKDSQKIAEAINRAKDEMLKLSGK
ncbi:MAG: hypothetical protein A2Z97_07105 [Bdellovibrionales bacterium GWB1_52_6]|nr:MAG: hypothetical protein A2Z97_07105 [Bdellovibrionales bacterium GWB1_52_6]OFZ06288.1 MAG: hypothetical protein A2X97_02380 [Bdellovibrionales bacterium GWA1_52_35]HCM40037.1 hypothetical protein [Bdellovibrionales bacterium]